MEMLSLAFDFVLLGLGVWFAVLASELEAAHGRKVSLISAGLIVLGAAHLIETVSITILGVSPEVVELLHRGIVFASVLLIGYGLKGVIAATHEEQKREQAVVTLRG